MPRPSTTRLQEDPAATPGKARVIDADFRVVGKRSILDHIMRFLLALLIAALIGALVPVAWVLAEEIAAFFSR